MIRRKLPPRRPPAPSKARAPKKHKTQAECLARFLLPLPPQTDDPAERQHQRSLFERHDTTVLAIRLPLAPSVNQYRAIFHDRLITSAEGRAYHKAIDQLWWRHWKGKPPEPLTGRLRLLITTVAPRNGEMDLDNRIKPLQDAMKEAGVFINDSQIDDLRTIRGTPCFPGWMDVVIETISE